MNYVVQGGQPYRAFPFSKAFLVRRSGGLNHFHVFFLMISHLHRIYRMIRRFRSVGRRRRVGKARTTGKNDKMMDVEYFSATYLYCFLYKW